MTIEVCAYSLTACLTAQRAGASRVELCAGLPEGGTTPSAGLIQLARQHLTILLYVMIRPRGGDFLYDKTELDVMRADITVAKQLGADGLVFGILNADGTINEAQTRALIELAHPLPVTFHRAFDLTRDPYEALESVIRTGAVRILTSGQQATVSNGVPLLRELVQQANGRIELMAGAGVNAQNAGLLRETGVDALHLSGKTSYDSPMVFRRSTVPMASAVVGEYERVEASADAIQAVVSRVNEPYQKMP